MSLLNIFPHRTYPQKATQPTMLLSIQDHRQAHCLVTILYLPARCSLLFTPVNH